MHLALPLALILLGCPSVTETGIDPLNMDTDGDSFVGADDCDDSDASVNPGAVEICTGVDNNCDGVIDNDASDASLFYMDADADGYGDTDQSLAGCDAPDGYVSDASDCDDTRADTFPAASEEDCTDPHDYNCDGAVGYADTDADGHAACEDCDDTAADINTNATEVCDSVDNDCDGAIDEAGAFGESTWYADADGDGAGDAGDSVLACDKPDGRVDNDGDCNDTSDQALPGGTEVCDGLDNDCDGAVDVDATDDTTWYIDADGDGYGEATDGVDACDAPDGRVDDASDCNDASDQALPGGTEFCDGLDNDCDGDIDNDASDESTYYADADDDGFGNDAAAVTGCAAPDGFVSDSSDCDDGSAGSNPDATEVCDDDDNNCDGTVDEGFDKLWFIDSDQDGFGSTDVTSESCTQPTSYTASSGDCDDLDEDINPDETDIWYDGVDSDCDGANDFDQDGDGEESLFYGDGSDCLDEDSSTNDCALSADTALGSCKDILDLGSVPSGTYWVDPTGGGSSTAFEAYCDMTTGGGGWTQIQYTEPDSEGGDGDYAPVFSDIARGVPQAGSYKHANQAWLDVMSELRYSEPLTPDGDSYKDSWNWDFTCTFPDDEWLDRILNPGYQNQPPADIECTNVSTGEVSTTATLMNYQGWGGCWAGPRLWIGSSAVPGSYHGDYCVDCVVTWKCGDGTPGVYSSPSANTYNGGTAAFWIR